MGESELDSYMVGFRLGARFILDTFINNDTPYERRTVINSLIDLRNDLLSRGKYTNIIDELLIKLTKAKVKNIKIKEV